MVQIDIYGIGIIISAILAIVFFIRNEKDKALIAFIIFLAIMLLRLVIG